MGRDHRNAFHSELERRTKKFYRVTGAPNAIWKWETKFTKSTAYTVEGKCW